MPSELRNAVIFALIVRKICRFKPCFEIFTLELNLISRAFSKVSIALISLFKCGILVLIFLINLLLCFKAVGIFYFACTSLSWVFVSAGLF